MNGDGTRTRRRGAWRGILLLGIALATWGEGEAAIDGRATLVRGDHKFPWLRVVQTPLGHKEMAVANQVLVTVRRGTDRTVMDALARGAGARVVRRLKGSECYLFEADETTLDTLPRLIAALKGFAAVKTVEANGVGEGAVVPNDPLFPQQWALRNVGQTGGTPGADVAAEELWDFVDSAHRVVVAVLDSGLDYDHPDLVGIRWANTGEVSGNGIDDDGNGQVDDLGGWDFVDDDADPRDDHDHGTHVTGTMAARRNNGLGVSGVCETTSVIPCKVLNSSNLGNVSDLVEAIDYARLSGARVMNLSLQNFPDSINLQEAIDRAEAADILIVAAAGNQGRNNDVFPNYPSSFANSNVISVGNSTANDTPASGSNFGATNVDLFAPGSSIYSTLRNGAYGFYTGTSMSAPHVTAAAALIRALNPGWTQAEVKACIMDNVDTVSALQGMCATGGRLNLRRAVFAAITGGPTSDPDGDGRGNLMEYAFGGDFFKVSPALLTLFSNAEEIVGLRFRPAREDVDYSVEASSDLMFWTTENVHQTTADGVVQAWLTLEEAPLRFLRVKISVP